jgi:hypothetical protein
VVRVTHPFHPWSGQEFVFVAVRQTWAEDRVFFLDADGRQHSLPVGWTDAAGPDVFVTVAAGRCPFRVADLLALARFTEGPPAPRSGDGGVRQILPLLLTGLCRAG